MKLYHYYSIYKPQGLTNAKDGDFSLPVGQTIPLRTADSKSVVTIIIPYHNSPRLGKLVSSIISSTSNLTTLNLQLIIVCSACTDTYKSTAYNIKNTYGKIKGLNIIIIEENIPGKPHAINTGLKHAAGEIIIQLTDDIVLHGEIIQSLYMALSSHPQFGAAVAVGFPSNLGTKRLLFEVQSIHNSHTQPYEQHSLMGRAFAFRKSLIPDGFVENIMSEDYWLALQSKNKSRGFLIIENAYYKYKKPESWSDYLKQIDRFDGAYRQLKSEFPDLFIKHVNQFPKIKSRFVNMLILDNEVKAPFSIVKRYIANNNYNILPKFIYLFIIIYRLYYLGIKNFLFPVTSSTFSREKTTL